MPAFQQQTTVDFVTAKEASATQQQLQTVHNGRGFCEQANMAALETYLAEQVQNSTVDIDANLALLKLYQVYPVTVNAEKVATVLIKGVMALPSTFFTGASTMVPESIHEVRQPQAR
jgi:translation initiation factor 3 subunit K